jgi:uncharacterized membrane protein YkgB
MDRLLSLNFAPFARVSLFVIYFWFGAVKLTGLSQASPLAKALIENTVGGQYFDRLFIALAIIECIIGILFLIPRFTKIAVIALAIHMVIVCSPLILVPGMAWQQFLIPTIEGQYIIKNLALLSLALAIANRELRSKNGV